MKQIRLVQIGIGTVGGEVVGQVIANRARWRQELGLDVQIAAVVGKDGALPAEDIAGLTDSTLQAVVAGRMAGQGLAAAAAGAALIPPAEAISRMIPEGPTVVLDAAAGDETAAILGRALAGGAQVVLSNKAPLALPLANPLAKQLWADSGPRGRLRYETTCGAGLPVISSLRGLLDTGDEVIEIQGALSGTLGAIFSDLANDTPFSAAVRGAKERGYTEPDPRDDLSGLDVARKALILARTLGREVDLDDISVESLVPAHLQDVTVDEFLDQVSELDEDLTTRTARARAKGAALKYVATVPATGPIAVGIREVPTSGVLGALQGPENVVSIRTRRYDDYPLIVVGPGAGAAVTAAGMLADMLALAR